jgi:hypothetical protein
MSARRRETRFAPGLGVEQERTDSVNPTPTASTPQPPGFVVVERKEGGREVVVGRYDDEATALSVMRLLAWAGGIARVERAEMSADTQGQVR